MVALVKEKRHSPKRSGERVVVVSEERAVRRRPNHGGANPGVASAGAGAGLGVRVRAGAEEGGPVSDDEPRGMQFLNADCLEHILDYVRRRGKWQRAALVCKEWHAHLALLELRKREGCYGSNCTSSDRVARFGRLNPNLETARLLLQIALLRRCPMHTKALVIGDASWLDQRDYELVGAFARSLSAVTVEKCHNLRMASLRQLFPHGNVLRSLHLTMASGLDDECASYLSTGCPMLYELRMLGCYKLTGRGLLTLLRGCDRLRRLELNAMAYKQEGLHDPEVPGGESWKLKVLALTCTDVVTDGLLAGMAPRLGNLQQLDLTGCRRVTGAGVRTVVAHCQMRLRKVKLRGCAVGDPVLELLARSEARLTLVSVKDGAVTDRGLQALMHSRKNDMLRQLCVSKSGVTNRGLTEVGRNAATAFSNLKVIDVQDCPRVSNGSTKLLHRKFGGRLAVIH